MNTMPKINMWPKAAYVGSPLCKPAALSPVIVVCVVHSPQLGKLKSLFASVTGQLTTETFKLGSVSRGTSVLSVSYCK